MGTVNDVTAKDPLKVVKTLLGFSMGVFLLANGVPWNEQSKDLSENPLGMTTYLERLCRVFLPLLKSYKVSPLHRGCVLLVSFWWICALDVSKLPLSKRPLS